MSEPNAREELDPYDEPYFTIWYGLWQIEQEAEAWMRARGVDDDLTFGFILDKARGCREEFEVFTRGSVLPAPQETEGEK